MNRKPQRRLRVGIGTVIVLAGALGAASAEEFPFDKELPEIGWRRDFRVGPAPQRLSRGRTASPVKGAARPANWVDEAEFDEEHPLGPNPFEGPDAVAADYDSLPQSLGPGEVPFQPYQAGAFDSCRAYDSCQWLPAGLLYKSYLAGEKEPRLGTVWMHDPNLGWVWESTIGGRVGIFRDGTVGAFDPEGWQLDVEAAAMPRLDMEEQEDLDAVDFRFGLPITWRHGRVAYKVGYYHISSHLGDEFMVKHPGLDRRNYVRDSAIAGISYDLTCDARLYGEVAYALKGKGGAEPLEFQFGAEYSPARAIKRGDPFLAANAHLREEFDFGGGINLMAGWQWRGETSNRLARVGLQYYNGKSLQYSFFDQDEQLLGFGVWVDY
ncbi:MAG: DUF1207 domain-containing protein [Planctomycetales bacterium]